MNDSLLITELLKENFHVECETAGPTNLQDIIEAEVDFVSAEHGSYMDLGDAIGTLVIATTFIKTTLDIYTALKKEFGRNPQKDELKIRITTKKDTFQSLDKKTRDRLMKAIIQRLNKKN